MATEKKITSRIQQKHDVAANWAKATNFIPKKGEIIIYDAEYNASGEETQAVRFKIGDGSKTVNNLPFVVIDYSSDIETLEQEVANNSNEISKIKDGPTQVASAKISESAFLLLNSLKIIGRSVVGAGDNVDEYNGRLPVVIRFDEDSFIKSVNSVGSSVIELRNTGVKSGTYNNVTVDSKGRVTAGESKDYLTSHQSIKSINTNNTTAQEPKTDESIAGSGTINLHKIAKTGNYNDLLHKPTLGTAAEKNIGTSSGNVPILDSNGKLADSVIPAVAITDTYVIDTEEEMLALSAQKGDIAIRSDLNKSYVLQTTPASTLANWKELLTPTDTVLSVNGQTGTVELTASDVKALPSSTKYAASSEVGGAATSANKVNSNLIVKLNSGATEGTNLFTFNGSAAKTINITPSAIGAAASSHGTHVTADTVKSALGTGSGTSKYLREDGTWQTPPNTATAADNLLDGSNSGTQITYAPYTSQQSKLSFDTSTTNPTRTDRLNLNGYLYATKLYSGGKEVFTSHQSIRSLNTNNTAAQDPKASEAIVGSGTINLHKVAKTGSYNDLSNKPTIPTVNNGKLTIQKNGTDVATFTANQSSPVTANITVPTKVGELANDSGYTTNKGTVTSVSVKMNGASKGTVTSSGTIDLGTVITAHQDISGKLDKTTYEVNKTIDFGSSGVLYVGKFKVYDTNVTCEVTSTTNVTYSGKLVIATQNYAIAQMTVYGDAANTVAPNFFVKPSTTSNPYIEVYFKPSSWSKNVVHIYGSNIQAEPTNVCTNVPSVPSTATLKPKNALPTYSLSGTTLTITL